MHTVIELMQAVDSRLTGETDGSKARALGTNASSVAYWRRGYMVPGDRFASAFGAVLGIDSQYVRVCLALAKVGQAERDRALSMLDTGRYDNSIRAVDLLLKRPATPAETKHESCGVAVTKIR
jgi:hypothetical protein